MLSKPVIHNLPDSHQKAEFAEHVKRIKNQIQAASDIDQILLDLHRDILSLFDAEDLTLFAVEYGKERNISPRSLIWTRSRKSAFPSLNKLCAGFCAKYLRPVNIVDA